MTRTMSHDGEARRRDGAAGGSKPDTVGRMVGWQQAHEALVRLAKARAGLDFDEGERLLEALRARTHERLGFGSFVEYVERLFGYAPRLTHDKLRVAEALEELTGADPHGQRTQFGTSPAERPGAAFRAQIFASILSRSPSQ